MISEGLRKHAFWLYGVIVGLAIKSALDVVIGHLIVPPRGSMRDAVFECARLLAFLLTSIQFYLGSVWFFDKFYDTPGITAENSQGYAVDYLFGLAHFVAFFAWAMSIDTHRGHLRLFPIMLLLILMYDGLWATACKGRKPYGEVRKWAWVNFSEIILALMVYCGIYLLLIAFWDMSSPTKHRIAECVALMPVVAISVVDIIGMVTDRQIIADWVIGRFSSQPPASP